MTTDKFEEFLDISIQIDDGKVYTKNLGRDSKIDKLDINRALIEHPGKSAWWSTLSALAEDKEAKIEILLKQYKAELDLSIRNGSYFMKNPLKKPLITTQGGTDVKITEAVVTNIIELDEMYQQTLSMVLQARKEKMVLRNARGVFEQRRDMLQSYASNLRNEHFKNAPSA